jgi:DNA-binding response OmpR family regulator
MGAAAYLPKPFSHILLRARVGEILEKKWLRESARTPEGLNQS